MYVCMYVYMYVCMHICKVFKLYLQWPQQHTHIGIARHSAITYKLVYLLLYLHSIQLYSIGGKGRVSNACMYSVVKNLPVKNLLVKP